MPIAAAFTNRHDIHAIMPLNRYRVAGGEVLGPYSGAPLPQQQGPDVFDGYSEDHLATYLFQLPFGLGLVPELPHGIEIIDVEGLTKGLPREQCTAVVVFKFHRVPTGGQPFFPLNIVEAARVLYETELKVDLGARYNPEGRAYELWVSAETTLRRLSFEPDIRARTLERCLRALSLLLRSYRIATKDAAVHPVGPAALNKWVPVGVRHPDGTWECLMMLLMRPESGIPSYPTSMPDAEFSVFMRTVNALGLNHPFIYSKDLELSASRQAYASDDLSSAVVSFQTAVESTLYELWAMTMVDLGKTQAEIDAAQQSDPPFKSLVKTTMPSLLGGQWNIEATGAPVGQYWEKLYQLRNRIVHSGFFPQEWQYEQVQAAHRTLMNYVYKRLAAKWRRYPRTFAAWTLGRGVPLGTALSGPQRESCERLAAETQPYWWPIDLREQ